MYRVLASLGLILCLAPPASAATAPNLPSADAGLAWINQYRKHPDPARVPAVVQALSRAGALKDPESAGSYVGFIAGVLGANPKRAEKLVAQMLPLPFQDQWVVIRAIAYSGLPEWKGILQRIAPRLPERKKLVDLYLSGELLPLDSIPLDVEDRGLWQRWRTRLSRQKEEIPRETFAAQPALLDTLWGVYFAAGAPEPILRIVRLLPWSKDRDDLERLTIGSMAKFTLATNASRDASLLKILRDAGADQPKEVQPILAEVVEAAETVDTARVRKEAVAAMETLKTRGPGSRRDRLWWGRVGEGAISAGCVVAAVTGQAALGIPCVVGGALTSGALRYMSTPN